VAASSTDREILVVKTGDEGAISYCTRSESVSKSSIPLEISILLHLVLTMLGIAGDGGVFVLPASAACVQSFPEGWTMK
jgi:hypothetical protein